MLSRTKKYTTVKKISNNNLICFFYRIIFSDGLWFLRSQIGKFRLTPSFPSNLLLTKVVGTLILGSVVIQDLLNGKKYLVKLQRHIIPTILTKYTNPKKNDLLDSSLWFQQKTRAYRAFNRRGTIELQAIFL